MIEGGRREAEIFLGRRREGERREEGVVMGETRWRIIMVPWELMEMGQRLLGGLANL